MGNGITMNEVIDRIPGNPGRVLITPEDGSMPYYANVAVADNPIQIGTPINKALFDSIQAEIPDGTLYINGTAGTNTYTAVLEGITEYTPGQLFIVRFTAANTGASTLNINGLGARNIVRGTSTALISGEIQANSQHVLTVGPSYFHLESVGTLIQQATAWATARTLTLTGAVTGSASIKGDTNISLATKLASGGGGLVSVQKGWTEITSSTLFGTNSGTIAANKGGTISVDIPLNTPITNASRCIPIVLAPNLQRPSSEGTYVPGVIDFVAVSGSSKPTISVDINFPQTDMALSYLTSPTIGSGRKAISYYLFEFSA